ncbi:MAG: CoA pyrophosphatase [Candidatus Dactylopiibacterium sp.]|nr:CoA pyrophosphatase [Candidatus Dactylopiibacterium sp.]
MDDRCRAFDAVLLRARFRALAGFSWQPEWPRHAGQVGAGVLIPFVMRATGMQIVLTRRTDHLHHHPGQISFPGGRVEPGDPSVMHAALRETHEEIGVPPDAVEVLGSLPEFSTPSGFCITPLAGLLRGDAAYVPDPFEVAEIFEVPLAFLLDAGNYQSHRIAWQGGERIVQAIPWQGRFIWGATAGILAMLAAFLHERPTAPAL